jgi:hypothetical protein
VWEQRRSRISLGRPEVALLCVLALLAAALVLTAESTGHTWQKRRLEPIPVSEFSRIFTEFSEEDGFFRSDNFVSNETSYLHIVDKLQSMEEPGGAYIGVGPEQNFTYIAKIHPRIAFIVDIRRQAVIQQLMFKAIFHLAHDRTHFLSLLLSRPLRGGAAPGANAPIEKTLDYFMSTPADAVAYATNLATIRRTIEDGCQILLTDHDRSALEYIYSAFRDENLSIQYRFGGPGWPNNPWGRFPALRDLILERDLSGRMGNFLISREDYDFLREMHERNRIIPVVGDFAGPKALASIAGYLKANGYEVSVFYTSNVEQYLFLNGVFRAYVENVKKLPITEKSLFIRAFPNMRESHPARIGGHRLTTLLQKVTVFLKDYDQGLYPDYWSLATTHYIAADMP